MAPASSNLRTFLADPARPANTLTYFELQGFLFAVASAPELVQPSEWLPVIFDEQDAGYRSMKQAQAILDQVMEMYNGINLAILESRPQLPDNCAVRPEALANLDPDAPLSAWSRGFGVGHDWLGELWDVEMPDDMDQEVGALLMTLTFFGSRRLAEGYYGEGGFKAGSFGELAETMVELIPEALSGYAFIGRTILAEAFRAAAEPAPEPRRVTKIGRNDLCPCGSGKKAKKCCGAEAH